MLSFDKVSIVFKFEIKIYYWTFLHLITIVDHPCSGNILSTYKMSLFTISPNRPFSLFFIVETKRQSIRRHFLSAALLHSLVESNLTLHEHLCQLTAMQYFWLCIRHISICEQFVQHAKPVVLHAEERIKPKMFNKSSKCFLTCAKSAFHNILIPF